jgi:hypothetical protein
MAAAKGPAFLSTPTQAATAWRYVRLQEGAVEGEVDLGDFRGRREAPFVLDIVAARRTDVV